MVVFQAWLQHIYGESGRRTAEREQLLVADVNFEELIHWVAAQFVNAIVFQHPFSHIGLPNIVDVARGRGGRSGKGEQGAAAGSPIRGLFKHRRGGRPDCSITIPHGDGVGFPAAVVPHLRRGACNAVIHLRACALIVLEQHLGGVFERVVRLAFFYHNQADWRRFLEIRGKGTLHFYHVVCLQQVPFVTAV